MYHVNAWGFPFAAGLTGFSPIFPTRYLQSEPLAKLIETEKVTVMNAVPTIFSDLLHYADANGTDLSSIRLGVCGGAAVPRSLIERYAERHGLELIQAWGMTETSSISTVAHPPLGASEDEAMRFRATQGRITPWVEARLVQDDGGLAEHDGATPGELEVRGPWVAAEYYGGDPVGPNPGWLRTGDIGVIDPRGYLTITDRAKDLIKSGGEWISSVELENELMAHPSVREAAVIAAPDPRWGERPMACVVAQAGVAVSVDELKAFLAERVAKWWIPEQFVFIDEVPKTSTLKFDKKVLRERLTSPAATEPTVGTVTE
jgi:fatty-acyl-CoA synthase